MMLGNSGSVPRKTIMTIIGEVRGDILVLYF